MSTLIIALGVYLVGYPLLVRLLCVAHSQVFIKRKMAKMPRAQQAKADLPSPLWPKLKARLSFTFKDKRPATFGKKKEAKESGMSFKGLFLLIWAIGLGVAVASGFMGQWKLFPLSLLFFLMAIVVSISSASPILKGREQILTKMFEIGKSTLGLSAEHAANPGAVVTVLEWREILAPSKVRYQVPTTFNADSSENFLRQFNQVFGTETTWVPFDDPEKGKPGWNFAEGEVTLKETPPLPQMAPWSEHYVLDPSVAWSFFPIALGVENGIEVTNPKTGEVENVLGFDVSGEQAGLSKKLGTYCSPTITTSPMVLAAGGTGGGKALSLDTIVLTTKQEVDTNDSDSSKSMPR